MKTTLIRLCGCVLSAVMLLSAVGCAKMERQPTEVPEKYLAGGTEYDLAIKSTYDFHTVAENTRFRLDILKRTAEIREIGRAHV